MPDWQDRVKEAQGGAIERDGESGLDYAISRYDSARLGRFMSPDPLAGSIGNPQSLNRYSYVQNNPVNFTDPLGLVIPGPDGPEGGGGGGRGFGVEITWPTDCWFVSNGTEHGADTRCSYETLFFALANISERRAGGGRRGKGKTTAEKARDKALQDCLDKAAAAHTRALAALSLMLNTRLALNVGRGAGFGGVAGATLGPLTGRSPVAGAIVGAAIGGAFAAIRQVTLDSQYAIPKAEAAINDAYINRVLKDCVLPSLTPKPPQ